MPWEPPNEAFASPDEAFVPPDEAFAPPPAALGSEALRVGGPPPAEFPSETAQPVATVPSQVRGAVGAATTPQGRLETLNKYYPFAKITPQGDNFIIEEPGKGQLVYNPTGLDIGDVASIRPEIGEGIGGTAGAALGATLGGPVGGIAGAGLGAAAGRELMTQASRVTSGTVDPRTMGQVAGDFGMTAGLNAVGTALPAAGGALVRGATKALFRGGKNGLRQFQQAVADADRWGVPASVGEANTVLSTTGGAPSFSAWRMFDNFAPVTVRNARGKAAEAAGGALKRLAQQVGQGRGTSYTGVGAAVEKGISAHGKAFRATGHALDAVFFNQVPANTSIPMTNTAAAVQRAMPTLPSMPATTEAAMKSPFGTRMQNLMEDIQAGQGNLTLADVRAYRGQIGDMIASGQALVEDIPTIKLSDLHRALSSDMVGAAKAAGPSAEAAYQKAQTFWKRELRAMEDVLQPLAAKRVPSEVARALENKMKNAPEYVSEVMRVLSPKQRDTVRSGVLASLGHVDGAQGQLKGTWSFERFLADWQGLDPKTRNILFRDRTYVSDLDALVRTSTRLGIKERPPVIPGYMVSGAVGAAAVGLIGAATGGAGWLILPVGAALTMAGAGASSRLLRNRAFVHWLAKSTTMEPNGFSAHVGRLSAIGANADPQTRTDIQDFLGILAEGE